MTDELDLDGELEALPLDRNPEAPRRRTQLNAQAAIPAALLVGALAVAVLSVGAPTEPQSEGAEPPLTPAPTTSVAGAAAATAETTMTPPTTTVSSGFARFAASRANAWIDPAGPLADGQTVLLHAESPFLAVDGVGYALCRVGVDDACTALTATEWAGGVPNTMTVRLPRRFTDWGGTEHDCAARGPCELRLWAQDGVIIELNVPVHFDPAADPVAPIDATSEMTMAGLRTAVLLRVEGTTGFTVLACTTHPTGACAADPIMSSADVFDGTEVSFSVERLIHTPRGPHDCAVDGPCELRFTTDDGRLVNPVPLGFDETLSRARPHIDVRPTAGLADGQLVELRVSGVDDGRVSYSLCAAERFFCTRLGNAEIGEGLTRRIPRVIEQPATSFDGPRLIDCAAETCVVRAVAGGMAVDQVVTFSPDVDALAPPEVALADATRSHRPGEDVVVAVRGLFVADPDPLARTPVSVRFCENPDAPPARCVNAIGADNGVGPDGRFEITVAIPNFDRRRSRIGSNGERTPFCSEQCWIVVSTPLATQGAAIAIDIDPSADRAG